MRAKFEKMPDKNGPKIAPHNAATVTDRKIVFFILNPLISEPDKNGFPAFDVNNAVNIVRVHALK